MKQLHSNLLLLICTLLLSGLIACCGNSRRIALQQKQEFSSVKRTAEVIPVLDTTWGNFTFNITLSEYNDSLPDEIRYTTENGSLIEGIYDASSLYELDTRPIIVFDHQKIFNTCFLKLSDSTAIIALRDIGMDRANLKLISRNQKGQLNIPEDNHENRKMFLRGQVNYIAYVPDKDYFLLHTSGIQEDDSGNSYRNVIKYVLRNGGFDWVEEYHVDLRNEELFQERQFDDYVAFYKRVIADFVR